MAFRILHQGEEADDHSVCKHICIVIHDDVCGIGDVNVPFRQVEGGGIYVQHDQIGPYGEV